MKISNTSIELESENGATFFNITGQVKAFVAETAVRNGHVIVFTPHTTCSVFLQEASHDTASDGTEFMMADMTGGLEKLFPTYQKGTYLHPGPQHIEAALGYGETYPSLLNTDAHLRSAMLGRSEIIPVMEGELILGRFASIYFADFDQTRKRIRKVYIQAAGVEQ